MALGRSHQSLFDLCQRLLQQFGSFALPDELLGEGPVAESLETSRKFVLSLLARIFQRIRFVSPPSTRVSLKGVGQG